jgi:hypothetical protein
MACYRDCVTFIGQREKDNMRAEENKDEAFNVCQHCSASLYVRVSIQSRMVHCMLTGTRLSPAVLRVMFMNGAQVHGQRIAKQNTSHSCDNASSNEGRTTLLFLRR